jgi:hypothetical protein
VIIRREGDRWALVLQTDHGDLSGQLARHWGDDGEGRFRRPRPFASVAVAAAHHDDGWSAWEAAPRAVDFVDLDVPTHLRLYRAGIARAAGLDRYAGLLVSLHGVGLYNRRFGTVPEMVMKSEAAETRDLVEAFRRDQEELQAGLCAELGGAMERGAGGAWGPAAAAGASAGAEDGFSGELWRNYRLLQVFDRLSLFFCTQPVDARAPADLGPAPTRPGDPDATLRLTPQGSGRVAVSPYPFDKTPLVVSLIVRRVPAGATLPAAFATAVPEAEAYTLVAG